MGTLDSVTCTSAIFAWWKVRGGNFAQPLDVGVFGSEALPGELCVTRTATLTRILVPAARAVSERARPPASQCWRRRASRASLRSRTRTAAQGAVGRLLRGLGELGGAGHVQRSQLEAQSRTSGSPNRPPLALDYPCGTAPRTPVRTDEGRAPGRWPVLRSPRRPSETGQARKARRYADLPTRAASSPARPCSLRQLRGAAL